MIHLPMATYRRAAGLPSIKRGPKRKSPERDFQVALVKTLRRYSRCLFWAVPNHGYRHLFTATKLRAEGVMRGVPDLHFILPGGRLACLELKAKGGSLSAEQKWFRDKAQETGALWATARTLDEAYSILVEWGVLPTGFDQQNNNQKRQTMNLTSNLEELTP